MGASIITTLKKPTLEREGSWGCKGWRTPTAGGVPYEALEQPWALEARAVTIAIRLQPQ